MGSRPTKAERREMARRERERIARRAAARRRTRTATLALIAVAILGATAYLVSTSSDEGGGGRALDDLMTAEAPWPNNNERMPARVSELGLPPAGEAKHIHVPIWIFIEGTEVPVPADIGVSSVHSPIHMHEANRQLHVESADPDRVFNLGEFFDVWGLRFGSECIGGYCEGANTELRVFAGGQPFGGDPRTVPLEDGVAIVVTFGTEEQLPAPIPTGLTA